MPTDREIQDYTLRLTGLVPSDLPPTDRACPICFEPYAQQLIYSPLHGLLWTSTFEGATTTANLGGAGEYPVSVRSKHPRSRCRHVFGSRCIEMHFRSGGPCCTKCPTCREEWFDHEEAVLDEEIGAGVELVTTDAGDLMADTRSAEGVDFVRIEVPQAVRLTARNREVANLPGRGPEQREVFNYFPEPPQTYVYSVHEMAPTGIAVQPRTDFLRLTGSQATPRAAQQELPEEREELPDVQRQDRLDNRGKLNRAIAFLERMLLTLDIDEARDGLTLRVQEVENAVENLWNQLGSGGDDADLRAALMQPFRVVPSRARVPSSATHDGLSRS
ncbi:uncharacterized protein EI97DRAFT_55496 [Westerdykella ornata]|uniref:RING-type domain-containing protein n=1 Tax=Westerdykella ornata TaxID=318751 RepID=A0A6A6JHD4_WESOR|nr:uncharacterized protein EI97DRAFT_55496 [Westerdykella ornata]KAF2275787.1 hypothetical protein EI97DRAFT_55496 [Westerdykella ornata]